MKTAQALDPVMRCQVEFCPDIINTVLSLTAAEKKSPKRSSIPARLTTDAYPWCTCISGGGEDAGLQAALGFSAAALSRLRVL